ncbi:MAG: glycosyltransferase family 4 protein [candidate division KSB1 bacterium]|nr:glycosyltransferase family 4 protein [candidate division KSB1 bacterium]
MRIGIDTLAAHYKKTGIGTYISSLANALPRVDGTNEYRLLVSHENAPIFEDGLPRMTKVFGPKIVDYTPVRVVWEHICLPGVAAREGVNLLHCPTFIVPLLWRGPTVVTIHDLTWFTHPQQHVLVKRVYYQRLIPVAVQKAARVIAITESTRRDLLRILPVSEEKVVVVPYGVDSIFQTVEDDERIAALRRRYGVPERYLLFVGMLEPRKNLVRVVQAFGRLKSSDRAMPHKLVLAGNKGWGYEEARREVERLGLEQEVIFTGPVPHDELPPLFSGADLFVYPSLYEGFGLPVVEAMACGTPVITSNVSSLPEVAGDAALLVDPLDVEDLAEAMRRVLTDGDLRQQMRARGLEQASNFTWEETARRTLEVYEQAYALAGGRS